MLIFEPAEIQNRPQPKRNWQQLLLIFAISLLATSGCGDDKPQPSIAKSKPNVIDQLIQQSDSKDEGLIAQGREAIAMNSTRPNPNLPPLISFANLPADSHQRMVAALSKIRDLNKFEEGFFGTTSIKEKETTAEAIPGEQIQEKFNALMKLGMHRLWLGDTDQSIEHYLNAYQIVQQSEGNVPDKVITNAAFQVALAYLRKAENENCVQCNNGESCLLPIQAGGIHQQTDGSTQSLKYLDIVLRRDPDHLAAKWLFNVASMTLGKYPTEVPPEYRIDPENFQSEIEFPRFDNVATSMGLSTVNLSGGVIWDDFDNDNDLDLVTSAWGAGDQLLYFRNDRQNGMTNATEEANLKGIFGGLNLLQADYDNDGDLDVLVLRGAWSEADGRIPNSLLRNDGSGRFEDVTFEVGLAKDNFPTQTAVWFDLENDGDLDLFVGNEKYPCQLFENNKGRFHDVAKGEATKNFRYTKAVIAGDINGDGWTDLYISNHGQANRLLINDGQSGFNDQAESFGVKMPLMSFPAWFWDYNNDGQLDLLVTGYSYGHTFVSEKYFGQDSGKEAIRLYQGSGTGFDDVTEQVGLDIVVQPMGSNLGDLDNDGFQDFYLGTGCPEYDTLMPNLMFYNRGGKSFADVTTAGGFGHLQKGHAIAFADIDNDGDQDIFAQMGGAYPGDAAANALYQNPGRTISNWDHNWITLKLVGTQSNRSALGARIKLDVIDQDGTIRSIYRWVSSGGSFGANPLRQEIGIGNAEKISKIEITWPATQKVQTFENIQPNQFLQITEGTPELKKLDLAPFHFPQQK